MKYVIIIPCLGIWLIIDGVVSMIVYRKQTLQEHLVRVVRATVGAILVILYFL